MSTVNNKKSKGVGPDGLTKKERRALKVQSRPNQEPLVNTPVKIVNETKISKDVKQNLIVPEKTVEETPKQVNNVENKSKAELTEKELRKLEWEKKLAAQKQESKDKTDGLSKAELKAKRREQQEAQRLAKIQKDEQKPTKDKALQPQQQKQQEQKKVIPIPKPNKPKLNINRVELVQHLYNEASNKTHLDDQLVNFKNVHPAFIRLGVQYSTKTILGSNARCLALLSALKQLVDDLQSPSKQEFCRYLESVLQECTNYLQRCRPMAVSMTNALRQFNLQLTQLDTNLSDNEKRAQLVKFIDDYIKDDIITAGVAIRDTVNAKISNNDAILTYGCSSLINTILIEAHKEGKKFEVIVVDGRPHLEGRETVRRLVDAGIHCKYVLINAISYVMGSVSKVLLGAHALLTNGYVMSRIGTAQVALVAQAFNKPVLVCCEKYKFSERVQTDSFVYNEIGEEDKLASIDTQKSISPLDNWKNNSKLTPLNLLYDVTPPDLVSAVVTELAILPCTSVPAVLRINAKEIS